MISPEIFTDLWDFHDKKGFFGDNNSYVTENDKNLIE